MVLAICRGYVLRENIKGMKGLMTKTFMPTVATQEELKDLQLKGLQWTVRHAYDGSAFYRKKMDDSGVKPGEIESLEGLEKLPFTTADDLREGYPFPLLVEGTTLLPDLRGDRRQVDLGRNRLSVPDLTRHPAADLAAGQQVSHYFAILLRSELAEKKVVQNLSVQVHRSVSVDLHGR